jgi:hypothetical protein
VAGSGSITRSVQYDVDFTDYVCESWFGLVLNVSGAPADAVITTFDLTYTIYHSVDSSRYKAETFRRTGNIPRNSVSLYNGSEYGHTWHTKTFTGMNNWQGYPVNYDYDLAACNLYGHEAAHIDSWSLTLYYTTGGGGSSIDLVADDVTPGSATVAPGAQLDVSYRGHVGGSGSVGSGFTTGIYLSTDAGISTSDQLLKSITEPSTLSAGDQFGATGTPVHVTIPGGTAAGTYWIGIVVDTGNAVSETNEGNNTASHQITVSSGGGGGNADLVADSVSTSSGSVAPGAQIGLNYEAHVGGSGSVGGAFTTGVYLSSDATISTSDRLLKNITEPASLTAGNQFGARTTPAQITIPGDVTPGTYWIGVLLDTSNTIAESDETNNTAAHQITVSSGGGGGVTHWLIPGAASVSGLNNANWKTQISIVNPDSAAHTVDLYYVAKGQAWPGVVLNGNIQLSPGQAWFRDDPLAALRPTSGLMYVVTDSPGPVVTTRTYNDVSGVGRYGQGISAEPIGSSCVSELILPMVHSGLHQYHTNLGLVEADSGTFTFEVTLYSPGGSALATKSYTRSGGFDQITDIFKDMGLANTTVTGGWIRVRLTSGCPAHWTTYASVIDESTGDPTYVAPVAP